MKRLIAIAALVLFFTLPLITIADPPLPPGQGGGSGPGGGPTPVGAPIGDGLGVLLVAGAIYGGFKLYKWKKSKDVKLVDPQE